MLYMKTFFLPLHLLVAIISPILISSLSIPPSLSSVHRDLPNLKTNMNSNSQSYGSMDSPMDAQNKGSDSSSPIFSHVNSRDIEAVAKQLEIDGKRPTRTSNAKFFATAVVGLPIFLSLLPLSVAYQAASMLFLPASPSDDADSSKSASVQESTETFPSIDEITPKSERKYDVVLLGCTGFTGRLIAIYLAKTYQGTNKVMNACTRRKYFNSVLNNVVSQNILLYGSE